MFDGGKISANCYLCGRYYFHHTSPFSPYDENIENTVKYSDFYCLVCEQNRYRSEQGMLVVSDKESLN